MLLASKSVIHYYINVLLKDSFNYYNWTSTIQLSFPWFMVDLHKKGFLTNAYIWEEVHWLSLKQAFLACAEFYTHLDNSKLFWLKNASYKSGFISKHWLLSRFLSAKAIYVKVSSKKDISKMNHVFNKIKISRQVHRTYQAVKVYKLSEKTTVIGADGIFRSQGGLFTQYRGSAESRKFSSVPVTRDSVFILHIILKIKMNKWV